MKMRIADLLSWVMILTKSDIPKDWIPSIPEFPYHAHYVCWKVQFLGFSLGILVLLLSHCFLSHHRHRLSSIRSDQSSFCRAIRIVDVHKCRLSAPLFLWELFWCQSPLPQHEVATFLSSFSTNLLVGLRHLKIYYMNRFFRENLPYLICIVGFSSTFGSHLYKYSILWATGWGESKNIILQNYEVKLPCEITKGTKFRNTANLCIEWTSWYMQLDMKVANPLQVGDV